MNDIILESISDGVFTVDAQWRVTSFNRAAERITGIDRSEAIGKLCHEVFKSNMCEDECPLRRTMKTGKPIIDAKGYCVDPAGERIPISVSTALLIDGEGKISGGAETFRDLREIEELREKLNAQSAETAFTSRSPGMRKILDLLPTIADSPSTVLLSGETGTGKEVTARAIHAAGKRAKGPFIGLNCGALPDTLLESELFGYKKGAFTGADRDKPGRFKLANQGTLFLDEIGDVSPALQVKLLRVLQEREYEPLGGTATEKTGARIICATNKDLKELVERGQFRQDLYYRINIIHLPLPPLRERREDIPHLAELFLQKHRGKSRKNVGGFSAEVYAAFFAYPWPGNIRELENVVERAIVLCEGKEIDLSLLPEELLAGTKAPSPKAASLHRSAHAAEQQAILAALEAHGYVCSKAAHELGIDKATLYRKIKKYGIPLKR